MYPLGTPSTYHGIPVTPPQFIQPGLGTVAPGATNTDVPRPPTPWAPYMSYSPLPNTGSISSYDLGVMTSPSSPETGRCPPWTGLNPILRPQLPASNNSMRFNLACDVDRVQCRNDLQQLATNPPTTYMRIFVDRNLWIEVTNARGILVNDVLHQLYVELAKRLHPGEVGYGNGGYPSSQDPPAMNKLELIAPRFFFAGLTLASDESSWILLTSK